MKQNTVKALLGSACGVGAGGRNYQYDKEYVLSAIKELHSAGGHHRAASPITQAGGFMLLLQSVAPAGGTSRRRIIPILRVHVTAMMKWSLRLGITQKRGTCCQCSPVLCLGLGVSRWWYGWLVTCSGKNSFEGPGEGSIFTVHEFFFLTHF